MLLRVSNIIYLCLLTKKLLHIKTIDWVCCQKFFLGETLSSGDFFWFSLSFWHIRSKFNMLNVVFQILSNWNPSTVWHPEIRHPLAKLLLIVLLVVAGENHTSLIKLENVSSFATRVVCLHYFFTLIGFRRSSTLLRNYFL